jgi:hypothetical protein
MRFLPLFVFNLCVALFLCSCAAPSYAEFDAATGRMTKMATAAVLGGTATVMVPMANGKFMVLSADVEEGWADFTNLGMAKAMAPAATAMAKGAGAVAIKAVK